MHVGIALEIDERVNYLSVAIDRLNDKVMHCFAGRSYGDDVESIYAGVILVHPEAARFHPTRPLKYRKRLRVRDILTRGTVELNNVIEYDVPLDYDTAKSMSVSKFESFAAARVVESVEVIRRNRAKYPSFDVEMFERDLAACLSMAGKV